MAVTLRGRIGRAMMGTLLLGCLTGTSVHAVTDCSRFLHHQSHPDGTEVAPGETFRKAWRLQNCGDVNWQGNEIVRIEGEFGPAVSPITSNPWNPGVSGDRFMDVTAPTTPGRYRAVYQIRSPRGFFGDTFPIEIVVRGPEGAGVPAADAPPPPPIQVDAPCPEAHPDPASACPIVPGTPRTGTIGAAGEVDAYRLDVGPGCARLRIELTNLTADYDLYLGDASGGIIGQSVREGTASELIELTLAPGTYYAYVKADPARVVDPSSPYTLSVTPG